MFTTFLVGIRSVYIRDQLLGTDCLKGTHSDLLATTRKNAEKKLYKPISLPSHIFLVSLHYGMGERVNCSVVHHLQLCVVV